MWRHSHASPHDGTPRAPRAGSRHDSRQLDGDGHRVRAPRAVAVHASGDPAAAVEGGVAQLDVEAARVPVGEEAVDPAGRVVEVRAGRGADRQRRVDPRRPAARPHAVGQCAARPGRGRERLVGDGERERPVRRRGRACHPERAPPVRALLHALQDDRGRGLRVHDPAADRVARGAAVRLEDDPRPGGVCVHRPRPPFSRPRAPSGPPARPRERSPARGRRTAGCPRSRRRATTRARPRARPGPRAAGVSRASATSGPAASRTPAHASGEPTGGPAGHDAASTASRSAVASAARERRPIRSSALRPSSADSSGRPPSASVRSSSSAHIHTRARSRARPKRLSRPATAREGRRWARSQRETAHQHHRGRPLCRGVPSAGGRAGRLGVRRGSLIRVMEIPPAHRADRSVVLRDQLRASGAGLALGLLLALEEPHVHLRSDTA